MSNLLLFVVIASIATQSESFRKISIRQNHIANRRVTELADFSILHDVGHLASYVESLHHGAGGLPIVDAHFIQSSLNLADANVVADVPSAAVSAYSKVDKTGFIGFCADILERAIDLSHDLMQKLGVKDTYGFSIILLTIFSKSMQLKYPSFNGPLYRIVHITDDKL